MRLRLLLDTGVLSEICHGKVERPVRGWFDRIAASWFGRGRCGG